MNKAKTEITWIYSRLWVVLAIILVCTGAAAFQWRKSVQTKGEQQRRFLNTQRVEAENALGAYAEWNPERLRKAEAVVENYAQLAFDVDQARARIAKHGTKWREAGETRDPLALGLVRYRNRQAWGDTLVSDWLPTMIPSLLAWERDLSPVGVEAITIRTRGNRAQRSFERVEITLAGICR
jgi:membrane protein implicated in regulation of membrane protease activity